uniref:Uncharacterized protein n=1 Tax=viral metagenome TaxID=1070528 RepID=A0A6M3LQE0_9ZZZZ
MNDCAKEARQTQVSQELDRLSNVISELMSKLSELFTRLKPISREESEIKGERPDEQLVPLAAAVCEQRNRISDLTRTVIGQLNGLEL